jgi:glycosyltransferase involved in cell wall biosynthesis
VNTIPPKIIVILCSYNSKGFISEQLDSLLSQTYADFDVCLSDDESEDNTLSIALSYQSHFGSRLIIKKHIRNGFATHFADLVALLIDSYDLFLFCDQDDIWSNEKLKMYKEAYVQNNEKEGIIIYSDYILHPKNIYIQKIIIDNNIIVRSLMPGNLLGFDKKLANKFIENFQQDDLAHDWLLQVVSFACGAKNIYIPKPLVKYRQHDGNLIGTGFRLRRVLRSLSLLISGKYRRQIIHNFEIMAAFSKTPAFQQQLELLRDSKFSIISRYELIYKLKYVDRKSWLENFLFFLLMR